MANFNLSLILNAVDHLTSPLRRIRQTIDNLRAGAQNAARQLRELLRSQGAQLMSRGIAGITREVSRLALKLSALGGLLGYVFNKQFIETTAEFQQLRVALKAIEGSQAAAEKVFRRIQVFAKNTPLEVASATEAYIMLKNAGISPVIESLQALADMNAKTGKDQENFKEIANQLSQAWLKNKLQMEEVVVLNERGIAVVPLLARKMKKSEEAITDMIGKGILGRKAIAALFEAMAEDAKGASEEQSKTWNGMMSTLSDTWKTLVDKIMNSSGTFSFLSEKLHNLILALDFLQTEEGMKAADAAGRRLYQTVVAIYDAGAKAVAQIKQWAVQVGGFGNLAKIVFGAVAAIMVGPLLLAITQTIAGIGLLTASIAAHPMLAAITAVIAGVALLVLNWERLKDSFLVGAAAIGDNIKSAIGGAIDWVTDRVHGMIDAILDGALSIGRALKNLVTFRNPFAGGETLHPSVDSMLAKANPTLKPGTQKTEVGGQLNIKIDGPGRVTSMKSDNPTVPLNVSTGLTMLEAY
jgi:tape measure domain-containing protein